MVFKKEFFADCVGAVTILTDDRIVFQGQILKDDNERHHCKDDDDDKCCCPPFNPDFIVLRLTCDPTIIKDNGCIQEIEPDLFEEGDTIRINVNEIIAIGPSRCCLGGREPSA